MPEPLTIAEVKIVNWVEQIWNHTGKFPTPSEFINHFGTDVNFNKLFSKPVWQKAMENRGIETPSKIELTKGDLSEEQLAAVSLITDYNDKRTQSAKLRSLGIGTVVWNGWMRKPAFKQYVQTLAASVFDDAVHVAQIGLAKRLESGDTNAIKFYMELTGRYNSGEASQLENIHLVIARLTEVLQIHIKDQDTLQLIYRDFQAAIEGRSLKPQPLALESQI